MTWDSFIYFAIGAVLLWAAGAALAYKTKRKTLPALLTVAGLLVFGAFIAGLWIGQERPPLRTMGETRLWYSFFLAGIGYLTYKHWNYKWILSFATLVSSVFIVINIVKPEIHSTNLMPALQSYWFVPHVTVYILSYSMLGAATIAAIIQLRKMNKSKVDNNLYQFIDNI